MTTKKNEVATEELNSIQFSSSNTSGYKVAIQVKKKVNDDMVNQQQRRERENEKIKKLIGYKKPLVLNEEMAHQEAESSKKVRDNIIELLSIIRNESHFKPLKVDIPSEIAKYFFELEDVIRVDYFKDNHNFTIILNKDHDDIANKIAEIDNKVYDDYPDFEHEVNYIISTDGNFTPLSSVYTFHKKE